MDMPAHARSAVLQSRLHHSSMLTSLRNTSSWWAIITPRGVHGDFPDLHNCGHHSSVLTVLHDTSS